MEKSQYREFIKSFFEQLYEKYLSEGVCFLPGVAEEMLAEGADPEEEWNQWKLIPATLTDKDIAEAEVNFGIKFPEIIKCFLTTYFHYFENPVGRHPINAPFYSFHNAWNPILVRAGYLPFAWDKDGYMICCIDCTNMPDEEKCPVCQIDHEILFDFDEEKAGREDIEPEMQWVADNFMDYLKGILE